jgi:hypothetical protein
MRINHMTSLLILTGLYQQCHIWISLQPV